MAKYKVATFGKSAFRGLKSKPRDPAEELQELLDTESGELVGVVPLQLGALLIFRADG
jgi:hypothetical protein